MRGSRDLRRGGGGGGGGGGGVLVHPNKRPIKNQKLSFFYKDLKQYCIFFRDKEFNDLSVYFNENCTFPLGS